MENKRKALGKGLEDLFNGSLNLDQIEATITQNTPKEEIVLVDLNELRSNPHQPRKEFNSEKLQELSNSIKEYGVFQPIIVKKSAVKGYEIIAGERRVRASILAGLNTIPAIIKDFTDREMMEIALLENLQRENLNPIEEAMAYNHLLENLNITQEELAKRLSKSRSHITNMIGLLKLNAKCKDYVIKGLISFGHARVLSKFQNEQDMEIACEKIIKEGLSVRETEALSQNNKIDKKNKITLKNKEEKQIFKEFSEIIEDKLQTKVDINSKKIIIHFENKNDLERIVNIIEEV